MLIKIIIILKYHKLHFNRFRNIHALTCQRTLCLYIIIDRYLKCIKNIGVSDIFQIKHKVLTPADIRVHAKVIFFHNITAKQLIPQHTIIEISRIFHHMCGKFLLSQNTVILNIPLVRDTLPNNTVKIRDNHVTMIIFGSLHQKIRRIRRNPVITVQKLEISSPCMVQSHISGIRDPAVLLVNNMDTRVQRSISITDGTRRIQTAIIHKQKLKISVLLMKNTVDTARKRIFSIIYRNNNTHGRIHSEKHPF